MKVIRIEYMLNEMNWKCNVLAKDSGDGVKFLEQHLKAPFQIMSTEDVCEIHGVSTFVRGLFETKKAPKEVVKEEKQEFKSFEVVEEPKRKPGRPPKK